MNDTELLPCPFTGKKPDLYVYDVGDGYEGKITVDGIDFAIYFDGRRKEEVKKKLFNFWNTRVYPPEVIEDYFRKQLSVNCKCGTPIIANKKTCPKCGRDWSEG